MINYGIDYLKCYYCLLLTDNLGLSEVLDLSFFVFF